MPYNRATLNDETDERYHARHPDGPFQIDPNDPSQQGWVNAWLEIRNEVLAAATDHYFFEQYPGAPARLDPNDSTHAFYVNEWIRIRDEILGGGVIEPRDPTDTSSTTTTTEPPISEFDAAADRVRQELTFLLGLANATLDSEPGKHVLAQLDMARSLYLGHHFDHHDEWTSPTRSFDEGVGFYDFGLQVRVVGPNRSVRMGLVGNGPSDVGGWQTYSGAPTQ